MNDPVDEQLDAQLRAAFAPPSPTHLAAIARDAAGAPMHRPRWPWWLAAAAALLVVAIVFVCERPARGPEGHDGDELGAMWAAAFTHAEAHGFGGGACCDPAQDFGGLCQQRFAVRVGLPVSGGVTLRGCYCGLPTGGCIAALAQTGEGAVGVFVVPRAQDPRPCLPADCDLHLARRELGPLVLYAVSRSPQAGPLAQFALAP